MNRAFSKYSKVSFKSITPKRVKVRRSIRMCRAAMIASCAASQLSVIASTFGGAGKSIAIASTVLDCMSAMTKAFKE